MTRRAAALATLAVVVCVGAPRLVSAQTVTEPALKAAFLLNFVKFTDWPRDAGRPPEPVALCVSDPAVAAVLEDLVRDRGDGQPELGVRPYRGGSMDGCRLLYVHALDRRQTADLLRTVPAGVLTVSDIDGFARAGGIIELYVADDRMRFAINLDAARQARLRLSAKLLQLARIVRDKE